MASIVSSSFRFLLTSASCVPAIVKGLAEKATPTATEEKEEVSKPCGSRFPRGKGLNESLPAELPSIIDIKKALPPHCFRSVPWLSMYYAIKDLVIAFALYATIVYVHLIINDFPILWYSSLLLYWFAQSTMGMALFVAGHDCGHGSFSNSNVLNDIMGNILHTVLMCPFYMWKLSHKHHHKYTGNFDKDEVFYPLKPNDAKKSKHMLPGFGLGLGWFIYLVQGYTPRNVGHFNVFDKMFKNKVPHCTLSMIFLAMWSTLLYKYTMIVGIHHIIIYYGVPIFGFGTYLVLITMLHHTEVNMPWYPDHEWDFVKGQLSTVDRHYGFIHHIIHHIGTHQMHHMFIKIPHYHLEEATLHFRKKFPHLVKTCDEPIISSFMRMCRVFASQRVMSSDKEVYSFKHE